MVYAIYTYRYHCIDKEKPFRRKGVKRLIFHGNLLTGQADILFSIGSVR